MVCSINLEQGLLCSFLMGFALAIGDSDSDIAPTRRLPWPGGAEWGGPVLLGDLICMYMHVKNNRRVLRRVGALVVSNPMVQSIAS